MFPKIEECSVCKLEIYFGVVYLIYLLFDTFLISYNRGFENIFSFCGLAFYNSNLEIKRVGGHGFLGLFFDELISTHKSIVFIGDTIDV